MDLAFTNELRNKVASTIPNIKEGVVEKSITIEYKREEAFKYNEQYVREQANKICALEYFNNLLEVFSEIRYSAISAECCRELLKYELASEDEKSELIWRFKYYAESAIYRYYSFWEYVGRFFNEYLGLQLEVDKTDYNREKDFHFARQVLDIVLKKYYHKLIAFIFELWGKSKDVFDYRIIKTHKHNPRLGENLFQLTQKRTNKGRTIKFDVGTEYTGVDLVKLLMITHKHSRMTLEYISEFFDIGHTYTQKNIREPDKPLIIIPDQKTIQQFQKILRPKPNKKK